MSTIDTTDNLDLRELRDRFEELTDLEEDEEYELDSDEAEDLEFLRELDETLAAGIDDESRNNPDLIHDDHFEDYARDYVDDTMDLPESVRPYFDYERFAEDYRADHTVIEVRGETYYKRA